MKVIYFFRVGADIEICKRVQDSWGEWSNVIGVAILKWPNPEPLKDAMALIVGDRIAHHLNHSFLVDGLTLSVLLAVQEGRAAESRGKLGKSASKSGNET